MPLDNFNSDSFDTASTRDEQAQKSALGLFQDSLLFQLNQAEVGLAQPLGLDKHVTHLAEPAAAETTLGRHAQMLGAALGGLAPLAIVAVASRFGVGRVASELNLTMDGVLPKRSLVGLNIAEAATTGLVSGALLRPTDEAAASSWQTLAMDRATSGLSSSISFGLMAASSFGVKAFSESKLRAGRFG